CARSGDTGAYYYLDYW
nr:immunoglobulin heavy chain junction region [Macaca mulatta]